MRALGVVREVRVDLERDVAVLAVALVVDGPQDVAGVADVVGGERDEDLLRLGLAASSMNSRIWSSYASPSAIAPWKMVGLDVTPTTPAVDQAGQVAVLDEGA